MGLLPPLKKMDYTDIEKILSERVLTSLKEQGKTDGEIAERYGITPADVLLLRGWYGIRPSRIKQPRVEPGAKTTPQRFMRPMLSLVKWNRKHGFNLLPGIRWCRNEEIYKQYKLGYDVKKLAKMYFVSEKYLTQFIVRRSREEEIKATAEYQETKGKPLTRALLKKYKDAGKPDLDIALLHGLSTAHICKLRKKYRIRGLPPKRGIVITAEMRTQILEEYREGKPIDDICSSHGINRVRFSSLLSSHLTPQLRSQRRAILQDHESQRKELLRLQQIHKTDTAIAKTLGISRQRVHQMRVKFGIPPLSSTDKLHGRSSNR